MRISDWSSDVCSSDLAGNIRRLKRLQFGIGDEAGAGFFRLRQTEFRRRYGLYAKGAEKFPDPADLAGIVTGYNQLAGLELSDPLFLAIRFVRRHTAHVTHTSSPLKINTEERRAGKEGVW